MKRQISFNAGPAEMPAEVLHEASKAVKRFGSTGSSILELSHRSKEFLDIVEESKTLVKQLCGIGSDYDVVWMQGGGRLQFCMLPMNFLDAKGGAGYLDTGHWADEAQKYAAYYGKAEVLASSKEGNYNHLPEWPKKIPASLSYLHLTTNNTIYGTQWQTIGDSSAPLVADMSSDIFSGKRDYSKFAMFYAAAQKNLGAAGTTLVVIRKDFLEKAKADMPPMLSYKAQVKENSILNTANVFGVYVSLLTLRWIKEKGIATIEKENKAKAKLLYDALDSSKVFVPHVKDKTQRSRMNVCFTATNAKQEKAFLELCEANDITGIKGHRLAGGFRASLYNAIELSSVERLVAVMAEFEAQAV